MSTESIGRKVQEVSTNVAEVLVVCPAGSYFLIRRLLHVSTGENQSMKKKGGIVK